MRVGSLLSALSSAVCTIEKWVAIATMAVTVAVVAAQVFWRYVLSSPLDWSEEVARLCMVWMVFMVAGWAIGRQTHMSAGFLVELLPPTIQHVFRLVTDLAIALFCVLLLILGSQLVVLQNVAAGTSLGLPRSAFSLQVPIFAFFVLIHSADLLWQDIAALRSPSARVEGQRA